MTYKLIEAFSIGDLETQMQVALAEGWLPQGGVCVICDRHLDSQGWAVVTNFFHQALVKS